MIDRYVNTNIINELLYIHYICFIKKTTHNKTDFSFFGFLTTTTNSFHPSTSTNFRCVDNFQNWHLNSFACSFHLTLRVSSLTGRSNWSYLKAIQLYFAVSPVYWQWDPFHKAFLIFLVARTANSASSSLCFVLLQCRYSR